MVHLRTGEIRALGCGLLRCDRCVTRMAWRRGLAIAHSRPQRFVTLTDVGPTWQVVRARMNRLRLALDDVSEGWQWVWSVEENPGGTGHHVHCWQRGRFVRQQTLSRLASSKGMGSVVDIREWRASATNATAYALKSITYGVKGSAVDGQADRFLAINGHRLTHQSRGWWPSGTAKLEESAAIRARFGDADEMWRVVTGPHLARTAAILAAEAGPSVG